MGKQWWVVAKISEILIEGFKPPESHRWIWVSNVLTCSTRYLKWPVLTYTMGSQEMRSTSVNH